MRTIGEVSTVSTGSTPAADGKPAGKLVPVYLRSEAEESAWWALQAAKLGVTLAEFDTYCGNDKP